MQNATQFDNLTKRYLFPPEVIFDSDVPRYFMFSLDNKNMIDTIHQDTYLFSCHIVFMKRLLLCAVNNNYL